MPKLAVRVDASFHGERLNPYFSKGTPTYSFSPVDRETAEREKIPHGCVYCVTVRPTGEVLRIRRAQNHPGGYGGYNSVPAGHMDVIDEKCEAPEAAAVRELREETGLVPLSYMQILGGVYMFYPETGHVAFGFAMAVDGTTEPVFNEEIDPANSAFELPKELARNLNARGLDEGLWPQPSRKILKTFLDTYPTLTDTRSLHRFLIRRRS